MTSERATRRLVVTGLGIALLATATTWLVGIPRQMAPPIPKNSDTAELGSAETPLGVTHTQVEAPGGESPPSKEGPTASAAADPGTRQDQGMGASRARASSHLKWVDSIQTHAAAKVTESLPPSPFGTVKVLGSRGCTKNTQGWFLSVGTPEDYDFTVSEDGELLTVTPNREPPRGQFELVHCVEDHETRSFVGKTVRLSAQVKAEGVQGTSRLRLRGEDLHYEQNLYEATDARGTFDWTELSVETGIEPEVEHLSYGFTFKSMGTLRIRNPRFGAVP